MTTRVPGIPLPTSDNLLQVANAVKEVLEVREGVRGDPLDKAVTFRDLEALKLVQEKETAPVAANVPGYLPVQPYPGVAPNAFSADNYNETSDLNTPPAPFDLQATGTYSAINLSWQYPAYRNHSYSEVFRSLSNDLGTAQMIGTTSGTLYSDPVGTEQKHYYWVRNVSMANVVSAFNSTAGTYGETAIDVVRRIQELEQETLNNPLVQDLGRRIQVIENSSTSFITELRRIESNTASLTSQVVAQDINNRSAIEVNQNAIAGVSAQYTVKIDLNGHVSGFGLASTVVNGTPSSAFIIRADKFAIVDPSSTSNFLTNNPTTSAVPFQVVNGQVFIKAAFIQDASITNAKIQSLAADKITAGTVTAAVDMRSPILRSGAINPGQAGFYLGQFGGVNRFYVGNGSTGVSGRSLEFDGVNAIVRGNIFAYGGTIGGVDITSTDIRSTNYIGGLSGWRLSSDGMLEANSGSFRGNITGASGTFSGTITATTGTIGGNTISQFGIYSPNFVDGVSGWGIDSAGQAQFNNINIRGALRATTIFTGSVYRDITSNQLIYSVAGASHYQETINQAYNIVYQTDGFGNTIYDENGYPIILSQTAIPWFTANTRMYGPNYHATVPQRQRIKSGDVLFIINVNTTLDHHFSVWYRIKDNDPLTDPTEIYGEKWNFLTRMVEPQSSYGTGAITYAIQLFIADNTYIDFGFTAADNLGQVLNSGKDELRHLTVTIQAVNL